MREGGQVQGCQSAAAVHEGRQVKASQPSTAPQEVFSYAGDIRERGQVQRRQLAAAVEEGVADAGEVREGGRNWSPMAVDSASPVKAITLTEFMRSVGV